MAKTVRLIAFIILPLILQAQSPLRLTAQAGKDVASSWIPLKVGERWIFDLHWKSGSKEHPTVEAWTAEEVVSKIVQVPEGQVVIKNMTTHGKPATGFIAAWSGSSFLLHKNCMYFLGAKDWDDRRQQVDARFKEELKAGTAQPDLCFPMETGRKWGNTDAVWRVVGFGRSEFVEPAYAQSFHITGRIGNGGATDLWFAKGVGIVAMRYLHEGIYDEFIKKLKKFEN